MTATFTVRSSYADILCDRQTGNILARDYQAMGGSDEWDDVVRFDPATFPSDDDEGDCLDLGFWTHSGLYVPASQ